MSTTQLQFDTREEWLEAAFDALNEHFPALSQALAEDARPRLSVGYRPRSRGSSQKRSQCVSVRGDDGRPQLFITPTLGDGREVIEVLMHEVVHLVSGKSDCSTAIFAKVARKMLNSATPAMGKDLYDAMDMMPVAGSHLDDLFNETIEVLGKYPHSEVPISKVKKRTTTSLKTWCPKCDYIGRHSATHAPQAAHVCGATGQFAPVAYTEVNGDVKHSLSPKGSR